MSRCDDPGKLKYGVVIHRHPVHSNVMYSKCITVEEGCLLYDWVRGEFKLREGDNQFYLLWGGEFYRGNMKNSIIPTNHKPVYDESHNAFDVCWLR
jgi:hypothetical protein